MYGAPNFKIDKTDKQSKPGIMVWGTVCFANDKIKPKIVEAEKLAERIKSHPLPAVRYAKQAIMRGLNLTLEEGLELETTLNHRLMSLSTD